MASYIQGEGFIIFSVQKTLNPSYWCFWGTKNCQKRNKIEKVMAPKVEGVKNSKKETTKCYKG
jgi:hypothetical protein